MTTVKYSVAGMNCGGCVHRIQVGVGNVEGVQLQEVTTELPLVHYMRCSYV